MVERYEGLPGVGDINLTPNYTSTEVKEEYERLLKDLLALFNKPVLVEDDYKKLQALLDELTILAKEGDRKQPPSFLTQELAEKLQQVLDVMASAGIVAGQTLNTEDGLEAMNALKNFENSVEGQKSPVKFTTIIEMSLGGVSSEGTSLQMMIYTQFIVKGSEYFQSNLKALRDALASNSAVLSVLEKIKTLRSQSTGGDIDWLKRSEDPPYYNGPPSQYIDAYVKKYGLKEGTARCNADQIQWKYAFDRAHLSPLDASKTPVLPQITVTDQTIRDVLKYRQELRAEYEKLKDLQGTFTGDDKDKLEKSTSDLMDNIKKVLDDLDAVFKDLDAAFPGGEPPIVDPTQGGSIDQYHKDTRAFYEKASIPVYNWLLDGRNQTGGSSGNFANNIDNAVTSGMTLNDNQRDELNKVNYIYEQFIKIATALLTALNDIIKKFASAIGRT
jgi:hypothetical protein